MELLIDRGAVIDGPDGGSAVADSLHNGRGEAAELFAKHGARLDLESAAGVGQRDVVCSFFNDDTSLRPPATPKQMKIDSPGHANSAELLLWIFSCREVSQ
jgi:hypothetical protein